MIFLLLFLEALYLDLLCHLLNILQNVEKAMEQFWLEAGQVLRTISKSQRYIKFDEPEDLVISCMLRIMKIDGFKNNPTLAKLSEIEESHEQQDKFIEWIDEHEAHSFSEDDDIEAILEKIYASRINSYEDLVKSVIDNYIKLSQISLSELDNAYGNLNLFLLINLLG